MHDLRHHGDVEVAPGLLDLAVNVRGTAPPAWLTGRLVRGLDTLGAYPDQRAAVAAVGRRHDRPEEQVLDEVRVLALDVREGDRGEGRPEGRRDRGRHGG